jgi:multisubunit Na+/H+ antiporter MnhB subunit
MSEDRSPRASIVDSHQELVRHIEAGGARMRTLSAITVVVAFFLVASYLYQISLPYAFGVTTVTVNLSDPGVMVTEVLVLALASAWLYVGATDFVFSSRLSKAIKGARESERKIEAEITGS